MLALGPGMPCLLLAALSSVALGLLLNMSSSHQGLGGVCASTALGRLPWLMPESGAGAASEAGPERPQTQDLSQAPGVEMSQQLATAEGGRGQQPLVRGGR